MSLSRRDVMRSGAALGAGSLLASILSGSGRAQPAMGASPPPGMPAKLFRVAHLTDLHIQPERRAGEGVAACLAHMQAGPRRPDLVITGGDLIMDAFETGRDRADLQWDLFEATWRNNCALPVKHCLGNHDVWGWAKSKSKTKGGEPGWGKRLACDRLGLERPYQAFDSGGWHFVVLDSTFPHKEGYMARLDDTQFEWLTQDLSRVPAGMPVMIVSHMPIVAVPPLVNGREDVNTGRSLPDGLTHVDARRLVNLFAKHPQVKVCLAGHLHEVDRLDYQGVSYFCNGAVSGSWWKGANRQCREGYAVLDLFPDGTFTREYVPYGWKAAE